jgi:hypothetical protein
MSRDIPAGIASTGFFVMASEPNENAAVLPNVMSADGLWNDATGSRYGTLEGFRDDRAAVQNFTRRTRAFAVLAFASRVALVGGVLTALEFAV